MGADLLALLPEALLFLGAMVTLLGGSFTPRTRQWRMGLVAAVFASASLVAGLAAWTGEDRAIFAGTFTIDTSTDVARAVVGEVGDFGVAAGLCRSEAGVIDVFGDGSGGAFSSDPRRRRCGCGA